MNENSKGRSIFDVVAERRKRISILSQIEVHSERENEPLSMGEPAKLADEVVHVVPETSEGAEISKASSGGESGQATSLEGESKSKLIPEQGEEVPIRSAEASPIEASESVEAATESVEEVEAPQFEMDESPLPQVSNDIEDLVEPKELEENELDQSNVGGSEAIDSAPAKNDPEISPNPVSKVRANSKKTAQTLIEVASKAALEEPDEEIGEDESLEAKEKEVKAEDKLISMQIEVDDLDPIFDLNHLPKSQPNRVLKKSTRVGNQSPKKSSDTSKKSPNSAIDSEAKKKTKRVTLLDSYFSDL